MGRVSRQRVVFTGPQEVDVRVEPVPDPCPHEVRVRTHLSAISPGTEKLIYSGAAPSELSSDASIEAMEGDTLEYPLSYGYACAGRVEAVGSAVDPSWEGERVFSFQPHVSHFVSDVDALVRIPDEVEDEDAVLIPSVETAVNLVMDGRPMIGEKVLICGQGVVGLLTTALLANHPLDLLLTTDVVPDRRKRSLEWGASDSMDPESSSLMIEKVGAEAAEAGEATNSYEGADLVYELTGNPSVLNQAIRCCGYAGRIVIGSWYGRKSATLNLGDRFHRSRMSLVSSQVSTIAPKHRGRWTKDRRMRVVLDVLGDLSPARLITHRYEIVEAAQAYHQLKNDKSVLQPVLSYSHKV